MMMHGPMLSEGLGRPARVPMGLGNEIRRAMTREFPRIFFLLVFTL